jgi:hypothetical protein
MTHWSLNNVLFSSQFFVYFLLLFLLWLLVLMHCDQTECRGLFLFSYVCWGFLSALRHNQFWRKLHWLLRRRYIVHMLDEIFCWHQLGPFDLWWFSSKISLLIFFVWMTYLLVIAAVLKFPTSTVLESICAFTSFKVYLMKLGALTLGTYRLIIVISFWCIFPFISIECPSLSHLINVSLMSTLSEISIATPACFGDPLAW